MPKTTTRNPRASLVWWPLLTDALLSAVLTRRLYVRLLVSKWAHTSALIEPRLRALQSAADAGRADPCMSSGRLEIKLFMVPGWNSTSGSNRKFPGHTRVNHTKYMVTDRRINIGTSNMTWDYIASTAGSSFNSLPSTGPSRSSVPACTTALANLNLERLPRTSTSW